MQNRKLLRYLGIGLAALLVVTLLLGGAFAGGLLLAPRLNGNALAATTSNGNPSPATALQAGDTDIVAAYEQALQDVYQQLLPSVVSIRVTQKVERTVPNNQFDFGFPFGSPFGPFMQPAPQQPREYYNHGLGSGFVWDKEGHIVTNYHVVADATDVEVVFADGTEAKAEVLGTDPDADLAVIKVDLPAEELHPVTLGDSDALQPGQIAIAIGNPFGQDFTMTSGIISAVGRTIRSGNSPFSIPEVIQTDAPINPGNSGGPLLNRHGEVIGINTMIISRSGASAGIGFAVPINIAKTVVPTLMKGERYEYSWLGITGTTLTPEVADFMDLPDGTRGVLVIDVATNSPADKAGLRGSDKTLKVAGAEYQLGGDVITAIDDQPVEEMDDLIAYLVEETRPGDTVTLTVLHPNGEQETLKVTLAARPDFSKINGRNK